MALSNGVYFGIIEIPPLQDVGWEVRVLSYRDFVARATTGGPGTPLAVISTFADITISPALSEVGAGSVTLDLDSPLWSTPLPDGQPASALREYEHVWQIYEDGLLRFEFLGQEITESIETADESRTVTISGPGGAQVLKWGRVFTPQYPYAPREDSDDVGVYQFTRISIFGAWLQLLDACKHRGTDTFVSPTFTPLIDSAGAPWADNYIPKTIDGIATTISATVLFDTDLFNLKPSATAALNNLITTFNSDTPNLVIIGHTDSRASRAHNQTLSVNRAKSVAAYIRTRVPGAVMAVSGKGETQPIATNRTAAGQQLNRRVVIIYTPADLTDDDAIYEPTLGTDLLSLLKEDCGEDPNQPAPVRAEWYMRPNFLLDVIQAGFGVHRERDVVFYEGSVTTVAKTRDRSREDIANLIAIQDDYGNYSIATSAPSISHWLQREMFTRQSGIYDDTMRGQIAIKSLEEKKDEVSTWTITVPPYAAGRRVFVDYHLGDWIGISQYHAGDTNTVEPFRVMAVTLKVDQESLVTLELTLQTKFQSRLTKLQQQVSSIIDHAQKGTTVYITDDEPTGALIGDLWTPKTPGA
jgi:outer membrane protein OmpA-like peptidoglycan-associated protein